MIFCDCSFQSEVLSLHDEVCAKIKGEFAEVNGINVTFDLAKMTNGDHQLGFEMTINLINYINQLSHHFYG